MTTSADDPSFSRMLLEDGSGYWLFEDGSIINFDIVDPTLTAVIFRFHVPDD